MRAFLSKLSAATLGILGLAATAVDSSAQITTLVGWTNSWAYNDATTPAANLHGTGWQLPGYDTNSAPGWKTGPALFGNDGGGLYDGLGRPFSGGVNGFLTPLNRAISGTSDRVTFYFRKNFTFNGPANSILEAKWVHDDGIVVYINGTEAFRSKMQVPAPDPVTWDTLGANHDAAGFPPVVVEGFEYTQDLDTSLLVQGENTIAVELHQSSTTSSDVAFALQLSTIVPFAPVFVDANQPTNRTLLQFRGAVLTAEATGRPAPAYQWFVDGSPIDGATSSSLQITNESPDTVTRKYFCRVSNSVGEIDSREASVLFTSDSTPPTVVGVSQAGPFNTVVVNFDEVVEQQTATEPFTYILNDGNSPVDVVLNPGGTSVTITYANDMLPGTVYTISIEGVSDLVPNTMVPANIEFTSWVPTDCGGVLFETFDTSSTAGTAINLLTGHPNYPNNPRETFRVPTFSTRSSYTDDTHEQFGGRLRALFIPPSSGNWVFYLSSDDAGQVFFNPNGPGESGKTLILNETSCCRVYTDNASAPFALEAGKAYYLEAIYKEATGGDYLHVWAGPQGTTPPSAAAASLTPNDAIPGSMLGFPAAPLNAAGTFTITQQPADTSAVPNTVATFSVGTSSDAFKCYQWLRDGVEIPNANGTSYSFTAGSGDNGAKFSVRISIIGGNTETSSEATLTVAADTIRPTVVSASTDAAGVNVTVTFSEPMGASAAIAGNYTINGANPTSATLTSPTVVTLVAASPVEDCVRNALVITGAADTAGNAVNPNPTTVNFTKPQVLVALDAAWRYDDSGVDLGTAWSQPGFDDSAWLSGGAPLGFEPAAAQDPAIVTALSAGSAINTAYFRIRFNLGTDPRAITSLQLTEVLDDGAVYYFNGVEARRTRMADGTVAFATLANASGPEPTDGTHTVEGPTAIATTGLVYGENVLAVEVHPSSATSSDSIFAAQLTATVGNCVPPLTVTRSGNSIVLTWPDASFSLEKASAVTGPWAPQSGASGVSVPATPNNAFFRLVKQ